MNDKNTIINDTVLINRKVLILSLEYTTGFLPWFSSLNKLRKVEEK